MGINKFFGGNNFKNLKKKKKKKKNLPTTRKIFHLFSEEEYQNVLMLFSKYSHKIIEIKERSLKHLLLLTSIHWKWMKKQSSVIFKLDNIEKKKRDWGNMEILVYILL